MPECVRISVAVQLNDKGRNIMKNRTQTLLFDNRKLAALLIPLALDQLLNSFMGSVDTFVVSNLGSAAISAVSLVDSINVLIVQAFLLPAVRWYVPITLVYGTGSMRMALQGSWYLLHCSCPLS